MGIVAILKRTEMKNGLLFSGPLSDFSGVFDSNYSTDDSANQRQSVHYNFTDSIRTTAISVFLRIVARHNGLENRLPQDKNEVNSMGQVDTSQTMKMQMTKNSVEHNLMLS